MKKYITLCFALVLMAACQYKEDPVFEQKPTERTLSVLGKYKEVLEGHDGYLPTIQKNTVMVFGYILTIQVSSPRPTNILSTTELQGGTTLS